MPSPVVEKDYEKELEYERELRRKREQKLKEMMNMYFAALHEEEVQREIARIREFFNPRTNPEVSKKDDQKKVNEYYASVKEKAHENLVEVLDVYDVVKAAPIKANPLEDINKYMNTFGTATTPKDAAKAAMSLRALTDKMRNKKGELEVPGLSENQTSCIEQAITVGEIINRGIIAIEIKATNSLDGKPQGELGDDREDLQSIMMMEVVNGQRGGILKDYAEELEAPQKKIEEPEKKLEKGIDEHVIEPNNLKI